jgi:hypothetical protein
MDNDNFYRGEKYLKESKDAQEIQKALIEDKQKEEEELNSD